ncbi:MAG: methyl-accepting chemotaxis protein [Treponema sp.]|jgi:methyl-accepting chemotaxis protein|nr:methyl-accepting chemotaxis protein [Treponema sp.]
MKISFKLTALNVLTTVVLIAVINIVILNRTGKLQRDAVLENMASASSILGNEITKGGAQCFQILETIAITTCYDTRIPIDQRRARLQDALTALAASAPILTTVYAVFPPNLYDGMDEFYTGASGATETGQLAFAITRASGALRVETFNQYQETLASISTDPMVMGPAPYMVEGRQKYLADIRYPVQTGTERLGVLGFQVGLEDMQTVIDQAKLYETGKAMLYNGTGMIVAHYDASKVGMNFRNVDADVLGQEGVSTVTGSVGTERSSIIFHKGNAILAHPILTPRTQQWWMIVTVVPLRTIMAPVNTLMLSSIIFAVIAILIGAGIIFLTSNNLAKRIIRVGDMMKDISKGDGDLSRRLTIYANDEIGAMGVYFNETLDKISNLVVNIKQQAGSLSQIGGELSTNMTETAGTINEITDTIQKVKNQADNQANSVSQTSDTMRKIIAVIERFNQHIGAQSDSISRSSAAIEEMLANIDSVTRTLVKNNENVEKLAHASDTGRTGIQGMSSAIQEIAKQSESLLEITALMNSIAGQTNLLSMNAAIEAAHAGDSGKGFAVVADEIRKLAENSGTQSKTIASVLKNIKESIDKIAKSAEGVIERFAAIDQNVRVVSEQEAEIRNSMEEQGTGSKQILEYIAVLNDITQVIKKDSGEMMSQSGEIIDESKNLERLTEEITLAMNNTSSEADEINAAVGRVNVISGENKRHIEILISEISKFKTNHPAGV